MTRKANKISTRWILETRKVFRDFLDETNFLDPERLGEHGSVFMYPEWLIIFIAILSVNGKSRRTFKFIKWRSDTGKSSHREWI